MPRAILLAASALSLAVALSVPTASLAVQAPPGFMVEEEFPDVSLILPIEFDLLPDGRTLVATKFGTIHVISSEGMLEPTPFLQLSDITTSGDLGLLGMAAGPDYNSDPWVYFAYTVDPTPDVDEDYYSRVERVRPSVADPNVADESTREILIGATWPSGIPSLHSSHGLGALRFGEDGTLLIAHGDGAHFELTDRGGEDPDAFGPGRVDAAEDIGAFRARSVQSLSGGILRVDRATGLGVSSNPYWTGDGDDFASRVWCYGLRNPFRYDVRPGTGTVDFPGALYIGDVGWNNYEEMSIAGSGGENFGWPCFEGNWAQPQYQAVTDTEAGNVNVLCGAGANADNPTAETIPPIWWHQNNPAASNPPGLTAQSIIGGTFAGGSEWPDEYRDAYFIADFLQDWMVAVEVDENDQVVDVHPFLDNAGGAISFRRDPATGDLLYLTLVTGEIRRVRFDSATSVGSELPSPETPSSLRVRVSPQPASTQAAIEFGTPDFETAAVVRVFGAAGRLVRTLRSPLGPVSGERSVVWDGRDERGSRVASGVYVAHVECGGLQGSAKVLIR